MSVIWYAKHLFSPSLPFTAANAFIITYAYRFLSRWHSLPCPSMYAFAAKCVCLRNVIPLGSEQISAAYLARRYRLRSPTSADVYVFASRRIQMTKHYKHIINVYILQPYIKTNRSDTAYYSGCREPTAVVSRKCFWEDNVASLPLRSLPLFSLSTFTCRQREWIADERV